MASDTAALRCAHDSMPSNYTGCCQRVTLLTDGTHYCLQITAGDEIIDIAAVVPRLSLLMSESYHSENAKHALLFLCCCDFVTLTSCVFLLQGIARAPSAATSGTRFRRWCTTRTRRRTGACTSPSRSASRTRCWMRRASPSPVSKRGRRPASPSCILWAFAFRQLFRPKTARPFRIFTYLESGYIKFLIRCVIL